MLVIAHNAAFDRPFLEKRLPDSPANIGSCRIDVDWKGKGICSSALEFVAYVLRFFHDGHRAASDCRATLHALAQTAPLHTAARITSSLETGQIADMAVMGEGRRH